MTGRVLAASSANLKIRPLSVARGQPFCAPLLSANNRAHLFHSTTERRTDGVFSALNDQRTSIPWIEALRRQRRDEPAATTGDKPKKVERDLRPKTMKDSYHSMILPLARDEWLGDTYLNVTGHLRLGTVFMDLDALSGIIAYKHTGEGVTTVTAALDRITIENALPELCDLQYSGQVTYATGRSSMEITCKVAKAPKEGEASKDEDVLLTCSFTMVSLDPETKKPVNIPAIKPENEAEESIFKLGAVRSEAKKKMKKESLLSQEPNDPESRLIHDIWLREVGFHDPNDSARRPSNVVKMSSTRLQSVAMMQPQYRNRHNWMIFGGFLLKSTFELAFCCCASFTHARPAFIQADPCTFLNPVPVGSVLYLTATVAYTDPPIVDVEDDPKTGQGATQNRQKTRVQIRVDSKVRDVEHGTVKPTGQFHYTFLVDSDIKILPQSYQEYMVYIDARRRVKQMFEGKLGDGSEDQNANTDSLTG